MFKTLLKEFRSENWSTESVDERNFFDICRYYHYENIASNILSFYFDINAEHPLGDLVIKSFISSISNKKEIDINDLQFNIDREVRTDKGNYIDLLLYNDSHCIVIENKIYAGLNNDLKDYHEHSKKLTNIKNPIGIVLSIYPIQFINDSFINITYKEFITILTSDLSKKEIDSNNKYNVFILEFISNINNLSATQEIKVNKQFSKFVTDNRNEVESFAQELKSYHESLRGLVKQVNSIIIDKLDDCTIKQWPYRELPALFDVAVTDFKLNKDVDVDVDADVDIAIDSTVSPDGWRFEVFTRTGSSNTFDLPHFCNACSISGAVNENGRYVVSQTLSIEESAESVSEFIVDLINKIKPPLTETIKQA